MQIQTPFCDRTAEAIKGGKAKGESEIILYHGNLMQYGNSHFRIAVYYCGSGADGDSDCELQGKTEKGASAAEIAEGIAELL